jgi:hypothetical protein
MKGDFDIAGYVQKMSAAKDLLIVEMRQEGRDEKFIEEVIEAVGLHLIEVAVKRHPIMDERYLVTMEYTLRLLKLHKELYE